MLKKYSYKKLTWTDLEQPTSEDIKAVVDEYKIDPFIGKELLLNNLRPRVDANEDFIFLSLRFPELKRGDWNTVPTCKVQEIDFIIGKHFLITTHYDVIDPIHKFSRIFEANALMNKSDIGDHAGAIFYYMMKTLYRSVDESLVFIENTLEKIEEKIFKQEDQEALVRQISELNRCLIIVIHSVNHHKEILELFERASKKFFGIHFEDYVSDIIGEYNKTHREVENTKAFLSELRQTNDSLLTTRQNEVIKTLTVMASLTLPLSLAAAIFTIPAHHVPILGMENDFWIILGLLAVVEIIMMLTFKKKHWF